jgi:hypothetical protein
MAETDTKAEARAAFTAARTAGLRQRHRDRLERRWQQYDAWLRQVDANRHRNTT